MDLRESIFSAYDKGESTCGEIARRSRISLCMVEKLLQQRPETGSIKANHQILGRKTLIFAEHRIDIREHLKGNLYITPAELREPLGLEWTQPAITC